MASLKTSQETSGYPLQKNDLHRIARSGNNHKVNSEELFSEVLTYTQFETKRTAGNLIAGRWYKVSECGFDLSQTILVLADTNISWNPRIKWLSAPNDTVECDAVELNQGWIKYYDSEGNTYDNYHNAICEFQPIGKGVNWKNVIVDKGSQCCFNGALLTNGIESSYFNSCTLNLEGYQIVNSNLIFVNNNNKVSGINFLISESNFHSVNYDDDKNSGQITFINCNFKNVTLNFSGNGAVTFTNVNLENVSIVVDGGCDISESSFRNCSLDIVNNPSVVSLNIIGKGSAQSFYKIDGALQNRVLNSWAGMVVADTATSFESNVANRVGFSTVKMYLEITDDFSANQGSFDYVSNTVYLPHYSVVGVYLFNALPNNINYDVNGINDAVLSNNHHITFAMGDNPNLSEITFNAQTISANISNSTEIVSYHGITAKVGKLKNTMSSLTLKPQWNSDAAVECWFMVYGNHYD